MAEKLILPAETKVCATCSYWDGERTVDADARIVVVDQDCEGECLVHAQPIAGVWDTRQDPECLWEDLEPDSEAAAVAREAALQPPPANGTTGRS